MESREVEKAMKEGTKIETKVGPHTFYGKVTGVGVATCTIETDEQYTLRNISVAKIYVASKA